MSMLSEQINELRLMGDGQAAKGEFTVATLLREAADTIESLRERLQADALGSGTCELHDCEGSFSALNRPVWRCDCGAFMTQYTDATTYHKPRFCPNCGRKAVTR